MSVSIRAEGALLPSPTEVSVTEEIIWSANTGRCATGLMIGDVVAEKRTFTIRWGVLTAAEYESIRARLRSGFHPFTITIDGQTAEVRAYRGKLTGSLLGTAGGVTYYRDAAVTVIQQ